MEPKPDGAEDSYAPDPSLVPLSHIFPEVTPEEATLVDGETARIMERRVRIMSLYRQRKGMKVIARELGCSSRTVHADIHAVFDGWKRISRRKLEEHLADQLQLLAAREADIEEQWERSKQDRVEKLSGTKTADRTGRSGNHQTGNQATLRVKAQYGDPRLMTLLIGIWDRRCKLLGLLSKDDLKSLGEASSVKLISGIDPRELV